MTDRDPLYPPQSRAPQSRNGTPPVNGFERPREVSGSFGPGAPRSTTPTIRRDPGADPVLGEAFARPAGSVEALQRDPSPVVVADRADDAPADPWRDPTAGAALADPALGGEPEPESVAQSTKLGVRDVLFGGKVSPIALATIAVLALVIGVLGGVIGRLGADGGDNLHSSRVHLGTSDAGSEDDGRVAEMVGKVAPSVVTIETALPDSMSTGSGTVIDARGYILTNNHVIESAATNPSASLEVVFSDSSRAPARVVGRDPLTDVAVVKVETQGLLVANLGDSDALVVGEPVVAIGSPFQLTRTVTSGIVSALHRAVSVTGEGGGPAAVFDAVQTDAAINHGNSGGPLFDLNGNVIGMNTMMISPSDSSAGLGFAIPINTARPLAEEIIRDGEVEHASISVNVKSVSNSSGQGAEVENVVAGGPAEQGGLAEGDVITKVGDRAVTTAEDLIVGVRNAGIGQRVTITYMRGGRELTTEVTTIESNN